MAQNRNADRCAQFRYWLYVELNQQLLIKNYPVSIIGLFRGRDLNGWKVLSCYLARNILEFHLDCNVITENTVQDPHRHTRVK